MAGQSCEGCGSRGQFRIDHGGFFTCVICGTVQQELREEFRDEEDTYLERAEANTMRTAVHSHRALLKGFDYGRDLHAAAEEAGWGARAPSEWDLMRATQEILKDLVKQMLQKYRVGNAVEEEVRHVWLTYLSYLVRTDFPVSTYFADLSCHILKIGSKRLYTPHVATPSLESLQNKLESVFFDVIADMGLDRSSYIYSVSPYYKPHTTRTRSVAVLGDKRQLLLSPQEPAELAPLLSVKEERQGPECDHWDSDSVKVRPSHAVRPRVRDILLDQGVPADKLPTAVKTVNYTKLPPWQRVELNDPLSRTRAAQLNMLPKAGGVPDMFIRVMARDRGLSVGTFQEETSEGWLRFPMKFSFLPPVQKMLENRDWMLDSIYEHDALQTYIKYSTHLNPDFFYCELEKPCSPSTPLTAESRTPLGSPAAESDEQSAMNLGSRQRSPKVSKDLIELETKCCANLSADQVYRALQTNAELQEVFTYWQSRHLPTSFVEKNYEKSVGSEQLETKQMLSRPMFAHLRQDSSVANRLVQQRAEVGPAPSPAPSPAAVSGTPSVQIRDAVLDEETLTTAAIRRKRGVRGISLLPAAKRMAEFMTASASSAIFSLPEEGEPSIFSSPEEREPSMLGESKLFLDTQQFETKPELNTEAVDAETLKLSKAILNSVEEEMQDRPTNETTPADIKPQIPLSHLNPLHIAYSTTIRRSSGVAEMHLKLGGKQLKTLVPELTKIVTPTKLSGATPMNDEAILGLYRKLAPAGKMRKFCPLLHFFLRTCVGSDRNLFRTVLIREIFGLLGSRELVQQRLSIEESSIPDPPPLKQKLIIAILLVGLLRTRHAVTAADLCRWIGNGRLIWLRPGVVPGWLEKVLGINDTSVTNLVGSEYSNSTNHDKSSLRIHKTIISVEVEHAAANLIKLGIRTPAFNAEAFVPRMLHFCRLPGEMAPFVNSFLELMRNPLTDYSKSYPHFPDSVSSISKSVYGTIGAWEAPIAVAVAVVITARILWPVFVYHPTGLPGRFLRKGFITRGEEGEEFVHGSIPDGELLDEYGPPRGKEPSIENAALTFSLAGRCWIARAAGETTQWDCSMVGLITAGLDALCWLHQQDANAADLVRRTLDQVQRAEEAKEYLQAHKAPVTARPDNELCSLFRFMGRRSVLSGSSDETESTDPSLLLWEDSAYKAEKKDQKSWLKLLECLPTCQEIFSSLIEEAKTDFGFCYGAAQWLTICDNWASWPTIRKQQALRELSTWILRSNLAEARHCQSALSIIGSAPPQHRSWPKGLLAGREFSDEVDESRKSVHQNDDGNKEAQIDVRGDSSCLVAVREIQFPFFQGLYAAYILSISKCMQEPPGPTVCAPVPAWRSKAGSHNDSPQRETRLPLPLLLLLRRAAAVLNTSHLKLLAVSSDVERWLWIYETPARVRLQN